MQSKSIRVEIPFPAKGIDQSAPRGHQPPATCLLTRNVRTFNPLGDRNGGGKRGGSRRAWTNQVTGVGSNRVLNLSAYTSADIGADAPSSSSYLRPDSDITTSGSLASYVGTAAAFYQAIDESTPDADTSYIHLAPDVTEVSQLCGMSNPASPPAASATIILRWNVRTVRTGGGGADAATSTSDLGFVPGEGAGGGGSDTSDPTDTYWFIIDLYCGSTLVATSGDLTNLTSDAWTDGSHTLTASEVAAITDWTNVRVKIRAFTSGIYAYNTRFDTTFAALEIQPAASVAQGKTTQVLIQTAQTCYIGYLNTDQITPNATTSMTRAIPCAVPYRGTTANTSALRWHVVDGDKSLRVRGNGPLVAPTVTDWASDTNAEYGEDVFPRNCALTARFRGRAFLARQEGATPNDAIWYCSAILDSLDWRFGLDDADRPAEISAIAGTNSYLGLPPSPIVCLAPWGDDFMLMGLIDSIYYLEGDPGQGGTLQCATRQTGVQGPRSWCFDQAGNFWFMWSGSLYVMERGNFAPRNVSGRRLYRILDRMDTSAMLVQLAYDAFEKIIRIFITPNTTPALGTNQRFPVLESGYVCHVIYDMQEDAFHLDDFPYDPMGPWSVCQIAGDSDDDRRILFGGNDGYIRRPFDGGVIGGTQVYGTADDMPRAGTPNTPSAAGACFGITSSFTSAPMEGGMADKEMMALELQAFGQDSQGPLSTPLDPVTWNWLVSDNPDDVHLQSPVATGTWFSTDYGLQASDMLRRTGGAHALQVVQSRNSTGSWGLSRVTVGFRPAGRRRGV